MKWVLRGERGQLRGPFDTTAIVKMIQDGSLSGDELIAKYPGGKWITISREPEFYDQLLDALQEDTTNSSRSVPEVDEETQGSTPAETVISPSPATGRVVLEPLTSPQTVTMAAADIDRSQKVIDLSSFKKIEKQRRPKNLWKPLVGLMSVVAIGLAVLLWNPAHPTGKIRLLAPKLGDEAHSADEVKRRMRQALDDIQKDTVESFILAQNKLVTLIEGSSKYLPARALLCFVYKELWPYSYQDETDQKTVSEFSQMTKNLNLIGIHGNICEAVKLMVLGRVKESRGVVDNMLDNPDDPSFLSFVYVIKGELLSYDRDDVNAQAFFQKAMEISKDWIKPRRELGLSLLASRQYNRALEIFNGIFKMNPNHKVAQLGIGLSLQDGYQKSDEAFQWLKSGLDLNAKAPREFEAEAYFSLASLAQARGDKVLAKESAQKAFERNPNSEKIKDLLTRLGGAAVSTPQNNELIFLGDQYVRQGDCFSAQAQYKTAFDLNPNNGTAAMKAAKCLWQLHQAGEAIEWLRKAIKADPQLISAYVLQADYLSSRYDFYAANQILMTARQLAPNNYEIYRGMAQMEFRKNNLEGSVAYGQKALNIYQGDIETLIILSQANLYLARKMLPSNPKEGERRDQALKDSLKFALKAIEIDGTSVEANKNYAMIMGATNGLDSGIRVFQELIKKFSFSTEYRLALADLLRTDQRHSQAQKIYEQVIDVDPKSKPAFMGAGDCYRAQKEMTKALKSFLSAAALDPSDAEPIFEIGRLHLENLRFDEAVKYFSQAKKINPYYPRTNYFIGRAAFAAGSYVLATEAVKEEKKNNPYLSDSYILMAEIHDAQKQFNECASEYSQAIKLRAQPAEIYVRAAKCYRMGGSTEVAEDMLAIASSRESGNAEIYREQGAIFDTRGDKMASIKAYCLYLELSPNALDRRDVEARLNRLGASRENCNNR